MLNLKWAARCALLIILAVIQGCTLVPATRSPDPAGPVVRFVAFGDTGTATPKQYAVGRAIAEVCVERGCDFGLLLGDNFYPNGVSGIDDPQWQNKFEQPYAALNFPIYAVQGNHDNSQVNGDGSHNQRGMAEVDYHYAPDRTSGKWRMPARFYNFAAPSDSPAPLAEFFALDSNPLSAQADPDPNWSAAAYSERQFEWLAPLLRQSTARWKIAFAHHPLIGNGAGGVAPPMWRKFLKHSVCEAGVDIFFAGHAHTLQWVKPVSGCGKTEFVISGAGAMFSGLRNPNRFPVHWQEGKALGFFWVELHGDELHMAGFVLEASDQPPPRFNLPRTPEGTLRPAFEQVLQRAP